MAVDPDFVVDFHDRPDGTARAHEVAAGLVPAGLQQPHRTGKPLHKPLQP